MDLLRLCWTVWKKKQWLKSPHFILKKSFFVTKRKSPWCYDEVSHAEIFNFSSFLLKCKNKKFSENLTAVFIITNIKTNTFHKCIVYNIIKKIELCKFVNCRTFLLISFSALIKYILWAKGRKRKPFIYLFFFQKKYQPKHVNNISIPKKQKRFSCLDNSAYIS